MCLKSCSCCIYSSAYVVLVGFNWCCCPPAGRRYSNLLQITHWLWIRVKLPPLTIRRKKELVYNQLWKLFTQWNRELENLEEKQTKGFWLKNQLSFMTFCLIYMFQLKIFVTFQNKWKQTKNNQSAPPTAGPMSTLIINLPITND